MPLDAGVILLVLFAAVLHASWNALIKAGEDRLVLTTVVMLVPALLGTAALPFLPAVQREAVPFLLLSTLVHFVYFTMLLGSYRYGDLSQVYPISRGAAPALVAVEAWLFAGEALSATEMVGVFVVSVGIMSLAWRRRGPVVDGEAKAIGFALLTALTIAVYLLSDGLGVRRSGHALSYICWLLALNGYPLLAFTLWRRRRRIVSAFAPYVKLGIIGGLATGVSYGITIWAMSLGPMAHIVALRETNVIFGALIGAIVLKEPFGHRRIAAAAVVAGGAVLLNVG